MKEIVKEEIKMNEEYLESTSFKTNAKIKWQKAKKWVKDNPQITISIGFGVAGLIMKGGFMWYNSQCYIDHLAVLEEGIKLGQAASDI